MDWYSGLWNLTITKCWCPGGGLRYNTSGREEGMGVREGERDVAYLTRRLNRVLNSRARSAQRKLTPKTKTKKAMIRNKHGTGTATVACIINHVNWDRRLRFNFYAATLASAIYNTRNVIYDSKGVILRDYFLKYIIFWSNMILIMTSKVLLYWPKVLRRDSVA